MKAYAYMAAACAMALFLPHCMLDRLAGGTGEETTNGRVCGVVLDSSARPVRGAVVAVMPEQFDPVKDTTIIRVDTTDAAGRFDFTGIDTGVYNCFATHGGRAKCALTHRFGVRHDTVELSSIVLLPPGSVRVRLPSNVNAALGYVFIPGTEIVSYLNGRREWVVLDSVPSGSLPSVAYAEPRSSVRTVIRYDVPVVSAQTTIVSNPDWLYARRIRLNTAATGAGVAGTVLHFPVLIRLTAKNFPFSEASLKGEDIRFAKADSVFLPHEIKQWDAAGQSAEIWVKVDTVHGNDSLQCLAMYWGNESAVDRSSSAVVFDSAGGFEGVWHLNEISGTVAQDASHNGFNGLYRGGLPHAVRGPTGSCQNIMRPDTEYIDMGNVLNPGMKNFSIGVWFKRRVLGTHQALFAKTNGDAPSAGYGYLFSLDASDFPHFYIATGGTSWFSDSVFTFSGNLTIDDTVRWHYVSVQIDRSDNALCKMYIDGIERTGVMGGNITRVATVANDIPVRIGTEGDNNCSFAGSLGEVSVAFKTRSADWVKLCYMNQKEPDALVKW